MSALDGRALDLRTSGGVPPREQRILAPSMLQIDDCNMNSRLSVCSLRVTDPINLVVYYVPMVPQMVKDIVDQLRQYDPREQTPTTTEDTAA